VRETTSTRSVTLAARLGDQAEGGEILTASIVRERVGSSADIGLEDAGGAAALKGYAAASAYIGS
jgi:class 3 adenylate cyclase